MGEITYFFVRNREDFNAIKNLVSKRTINLKSLTVVLWDTSFENFFIDNSINYLLFGQYAKKIDFNFVSREVLQLVNTFPHTKILNGKTLVELLEYNGYSLWWFLKQGFYSHCTRIIKEIYTLKLIIEERKVRNILILNQDKEFLDILREAAKESNTAIKLNKKNVYAGNYNFFENKKKLFLSYLPRLIRALLGFVRDVQPIKKENKRNVLLFTKSDVWSNITGTIRGDTTSYTILRDMSKSREYNVIPLDVAINTPAAWKAIKEKKKPFIPYEYFIFKSFFDFKIQKIVRLQKRRFSVLWEKIDKESKLKKVLVSNKIILYPFLRQQIKSYFFSNFDSLIGAVRNIEIGKRVLDEYNIDATICMDENGNSRFLVFASRMKNVPSIALQHGLIAPLSSVSYFYCKDDLYKYKQNLNCQFPDKTAVFGKHSENMLKEIGNYDDGQLVITGQPRSDIFFENKGKYSRKRIYNKFGIDSNKKLVVFASQPLDELSESKITLTSIIKSIRKMKDIKLVIKLHPGDNEDYYKKIMNDLKYDAVAIKDIDLYELLYCSDLVISIQSTVILEALMMDKPVIKINLIENYDLFGGITPSGIIEVFKEKELTGVISRALSNKEYMEKIRNQRKKIVSEYFYKIDGNSTKRFMNIVRDLLQDRNKKSKNIK